MPFPDEKTVQLDHLEIYSPGQTLTLTPHKPPNPWGWRLYPLPKDLTHEATELSEEGKKLTRLEMVFKHSQPHRLDPDIQKIESNKMKVRILDIIRNDTRGPYTPGTQKLKCEVLQVPSDTPSNNNHQVPAVGEVIFLKVYDPMFFPRNVSEIDAQWKVTARADMALSNEVGAYGLLHQHSLTGSPNIAPQWLGCWTTEVETTDDAYKGRTRHVAVVALEYIDGVCLQKLLYTDESGELSYIGDHSRVGSDVAELRAMGTEARLGVMEDLLANISRQYRAGVNKYAMIPKNVIVSFRRGTEAFERPRVSLVDYEQHYIGPFRDPPHNRWARLEKPVHPWYRWGYKRLELFFRCRWFPSDWEVVDGNCHRLEQWLVGTFGPLGGNDEYSPSFEADLSQAEKEALLDASRKFKAEKEAASAKPTGVGEAGTL
ncbi:hypothetical protein LX32DRAFT_588369 [Colletotrichum zoysiae]|uniref:Uncharacterized protein n=1 Tax=Colletotrichum zoysiae TaxID=1216348 RepID=A0AAD9M2G4_9PEZI|nr:hypothetical protein LX32DRAFT_588369 [Colletotrichum zoysiae]